MGRKPVYTFATWRVKEGQLVASLTCANSVSGALGYKKSIDRWFLLSLPNLAAAAKHSVSTCFLNKGFSIGNCAEL